MTAISQTSFQVLVSNRDWGFFDADTQYLTHNLHRYSGKFIPQIARQAIELITQPGDIVLDPYVGSGTTLLEAMLSGRNSVGVDLNPLAVLIASAKVTPIAQRTLKDMVMFFQRLVSHLSTLNQPTLIPPEPEYQELVDQARSDYRLDHPWYNKWFQQHVLFELVVIHRAIQQLNDPDAKNLAMVAFSNILRRSSNAHNGYPNVMFDKNAPTRPLPGVIFLRSLQECVTMVSQLDVDLFNQFRPRVLLGDAANLPLADASVDAVVTHPPYIGSIPYAEYGALSLMWMNQDPKDLDNRLTGGRRQSRDVVERFKESYEAMLKEAYRVLKPHSKMFIMVGHPVVRGEIVDLGMMTKELTSEVGFHLLAETKRNGVNRRANKMGHETLLFFGKGTQWV